MANAFTGTSQIAGVVKTAYDRYIEFALRSQPLLRGIADKRPVQLAMPGSSIVFSFYQDMATATTPLTETVDPDSVSMSDTTTVTVTLAEYGNPVLSTRALHEFSFSDVDPAIANVVAFNMADSLDVLAQTELRQGTNVYRPSGRAATANVTSTDIATVADIQRIVTGLRTGNALPRYGMLYGGYIHPEVAYDLKAATGAGSFEDLRKYTDSQVGNIPNFVTGVLGGAYWIESPRMYQATDGATSTRVFRTLLFGQQALAEAVAIEPGIVIGPVTDKMLRFRPISWYGLLGWKRYREAAIYRYETTSSIHTT